MNLVMVGVKVGKSAILGQNLHFLSPFHHTVDRLEFFHGDITSVGSFGVVDKLLELGSQYFWPKTWFIGLKIDNFALF